MIRLVDRLFEGCRLAVRFTLLLGVLLFAFRIALLVANADPAMIPAAREVGRALLMGTRFDLKVGAFAAIPLLVLGGWETGRRRWAAVWVVVATFAVAMIAMINHAYYAFAHAPIDPYAFALFDDDTAAVFKTLWEEHHVLAAPVSALGLGFLVARLVLRPAGALSPRVRTAVALLVPALLLLAVRGRAGGFPLNQKDFTVSTDGLLNAAVPNGPTALLVAVGDRAMGDIGDDPDEGLRAAGFRRPAEAAAVLGWTAPDASAEEVERALFRRTPPNAVAARNPPHVVLVVMESWGADVLRTQSRTNDVLGRLAPHFARGLHFTRFYSAQNGTFPTLETLLLNSPITPLTTGELGNVPFPQAATLPFRAAGYRTVFGMGWSAAWRGIGRAFPHQGFDEVADVAAMVAADPGAPVGTWGVPDGSLFRWAAQRLRRADEQGERLLLVLMTASNHSPYELPPGPAPGPLDVAALELEGRNLGEPALRLPTVRAYQYACDALGGFLDEIDVAGLGERTIVAATGDHNTRELIRYSSTADLLWRDRVPLFLRVPAAYLREGTVETDRWAGHRDVFPTLAGLALSEALVFRSGEDLLAPAPGTPRALTRYRTVLAEPGVVTELTGAGVCWEAVRSPAAPSARATPAAAPGCGAELERLAREERARVALLDWYVRSRAIASRRHAGGLAATAR